MMMGKGLALHKALFLVFLPIVSSTIDTTVVGAAFENPTEIGNSETLTFGPVRYVGPTAQFTTRGYNGVFPAPTIRAKAGDTLSINLVNLLEDYDNTVAHNSYQTPNTTNLHTHGLHVSGAGIADNVFIEVEPGHEYDYEIEIPADHMGGTFWYHPHHHGSTAIQAGGGAAGIIIIEDAANEVPPEIAEMEEFNMMLFLVSMSTVAAIQTGFNDQLWQISGTASDTLLVNGMVQPVVSMQQGKWYRWRMVYASLENTATLTFDSYTGTAACEMQLLAKDGVYLNTAPREVTSLPLFSGARADVAIRCTGVGVATLSAGARRRRNLMQRGGGGTGGGGGGATYTGTVLTVDVSGDDYGAADLTPFTMNRPCYLADTRSLTADTTSSVSLGGGLSVNGASFSSSTTYLDTFTAGELVELSVSGFGNHPYHQHVNHFQITSITAGDSTYFQEGDWGDTIFDSGGSMTARFYADKFTGPMVVHCHILSHEDQGMMALWNLDGNEGDEYSGARTVDPTCYNETSGSRGGDWSAAPTAAPSSSSVGSSPTSVPISSPTPVPYPSPTSVPISSPTPAPNPSPSSVPISSPTPVPNPSPSSVPISSPTPVPYPSPTSVPISSPTLVPYPSPSSVPVPLPTLAPTKPTVQPTPAPTTATGHPTSSPVFNPTAVPIVAPTSVPIPSPTSLPFPIPTSVPIPSPSLVPIPSPTSLPIPSPSLVPIPSPTSVPIPSPSLVPVPSPTSSPIPSPTSVPISSPTSVPRPAPSTAPTQLPIIPPTPAPTLTPTPFDTVSIDVVLSLTASNCNISDDVLIDAFVATLDDISSEEISDFESSCTESSRRKLLKGSTASSTVTSGAASEVAASSRGRKLSVSLTASFGIQVSLSATTYTSATAFSSAISSSVTSAISEGTLTSNLNSLCSTCDLTADGATVSEPIRHAPSPAPTSPTQAPHTANQKKKSNNKNPVEAASTSPVGIAIICAIVAVMIGGGALLRYKLSSPSTADIQDNFKGDDGMIDDFEMTQFKTPSNKVASSGKTDSTFTPNNKSVAPSRGKSSPQDPSRAVTL